MRSFCDDYKKAKAFAARIGSNIAAGCLHFDLSATLPEGIRVNSYLESDRIYNVKFCPECGKNLFSEQM